MSVSGSARELGWEPGLSEKEVSALDDEFLAPGRAPGGHFRQRLRLLMLTASQEAGQTATHGRLTLAAEDLDNELFVHVELVSLLHQLAEAMWSLFLAVGPSVRSPSVFLAQLQPSELSRLIAALQQDPARLDELLQHALLLDDDAPEAGENYREVAQQRLGAVRRLLLLTAARMSDDRRIYNATKHGFAVTMERARIGFSASAPPDTVQAPDLDFGRSSVWLTVLERTEPSPSGPRRWLLTRTALDELDQEFWLVLMLTQVLDAVWACAAARRQVLTELHLRLPTDTDIEHALAQPSELLHKFVMDTLYEGAEGTIKMTVKPRR